MEQNPGKVGVDSKGLSDVAGWRKMGRFYFLNGLECSFHNSNAASM